MEGAPQSNPASLLAYFNKNNYKTTYRRKKTKGKAPTLKPHSLKPYPKKRKHSTTNKGDRAGQRGGGNVQEKTTLTLKQNHQKEKHHSTAAKKGDKGRKRE